MGIGPLYQITGLFHITSFFQLLEKTMYNRLNQHLIINNILATEQYGFRKDQSTEQAACMLINGILQVE
jgi:hypothetical protein